MKKYIWIIIAVILVLAVAFFTPYLIWSLKGPPETEPATLNTDELIPMGIVNEGLQASYSLEGVDYDVYLDLNDTMHCGVLTEESFSSNFWGINTLAWSRFGWKKGTIRYYASFSGLDQRKWLIVYKDDGSGNLTAENVTIILKSRLVTDVPAWLEEIHDWLIPEQ